MPISKITEAGTDSGLYYAKAWVNFNGTGTVAVRASGNVSSITDNGTGDYTVNFTNAMPDANYAASGMSNRDTSSYFWYLTPNYGTAPSTTACRFLTGGSVAYDMGYVYLSFFR